MATAETSQPLSIESFSYSWLINLKPSLESISDSFRAALDSSDESFFIEMDPNMPPSKRFKKLHNDFDFDLPRTEQSMASTVHADELFSNGLLVPLVKTEVAYNHLSPSTSPLYSNGQRRQNFENRKAHFSSLRRCRSLLSRKIFEKYLHFLCPFLERIRCCRSTSRKNRAADNRIWAEKNSSIYSPQASPRTSVCSSGGGWRRSCDSESSIHEAVLHCKRSIGM